MKIVTVVGARPQFIKAATVCRVIRGRAARCESGIEEVLAHTGQHFDDNMSRVFFEELDIPPPRYNLDIHGGTQGEMTGRMLAGIERILLDERPDLVLVYGDTNSTLAGALAAVKLHIPVAHVEAGLRSFNMRMPEEINRILTDRISSLLFCPTATALENLAAEGRREGAVNVGDVMFDASLYYRDLARARSRIMETLGVREKNYVLATCHRAENTDDPARLAEIVGGLASIARSMPVVLSLHPRTRKLLAEREMLTGLREVILTDPLPFLDMVRLEQSAKAIATDSGGVQKEAYFFGVPCVTMRDQTEWVETVASGWNMLVGADARKIAEGALAERRGSALLPLYGDGAAAEKIVQQLFGAAASTPSVTQPK